ncbi:MAG TPA: hypothetical protein VGN93_02485 [Shinella sp.]|uniref:hypothetical protein n=1 Tax=Shinella sp. TaxID=1870904 RepID=UPI002E1593CE|nr:hypothetical protein [Shinella sp.]
MGRETGGRIGEIPRADGTGHDRVWRAGGNDLRSNGQTGKFTESIIGSCIIFLIDPGSHSLRELQLIVLEESIWSDLSCGSRTVIPIVFVATMIFLVTCIFFSSRVKRWFQGKPQPTHHWITSRPVVVIGTTALVGLGFVGSALPSVTRVTTNGKVIVESGCHATSTYAKTIQLDFATRTYKHTARRRGQDTDLLVIKGSGHTITLNLNRQKHWPALLRIAPGPVEQFARALREQGKDIPGPLLQLLKWSST